MEGLFVTHKGVAKSPTAKTIGHFVIEAMQKADTDQPTEPIRAHCTNATNTSIALLKGVSMANTIKAANWVSDTIFARHYQKDVAVQEAEF